MKPAAMEAVVMGFVCFFIFCISFASSVNEEGLSLLALKAAIAADPTQALVSWSETDTTPCDWAGITCDRFNGRVAAVSLSDKNLTGYIPSEIGALSFLSWLDLSRNSFRGPLPGEIVTLQYLSHLDLSSNSFNGSLPESLSNLSHLTGTLNLSYNAFSGEIPASLSGLPVMLCLDFSHNNLTGKIPESETLLSQGPTAFSGNPFLCGFPSSTSCTSPAEAQNPRFSSDPENPHDARISPNVLDQNGKVKGGMVIVAVIFGVSLLLGLVSVSTWAITRKRGKEETKSGCESPSTEEITGRDEQKKGRFVVVDEDFGLGLEDLLRASAYVLGKSKTGILYKVAIGGGKSGLASASVAVRRLSEADGDAALRFRDFEVEIDAIARVEHPNIMKIKAYYFSPDEKFLVSEFMKNGSLHTALHGTANTSSPPPLPWASRLRIAQEVAKGLTHIHECSNRKYIHGSITSSKILLDDDMKPYISGFGLSRLSQAASKSGSSSNRSQTIVTAESSLMYIAPEVRDGSSRLTQKCDVYSFGIVLLELLTGRVPDSGSESMEGVVREVFREERRLAEIIDPNLLSEIDAKKQVVAVFHIALSCTEADPDARPRMRVVSDNLDCIKLL